MHIALWVNGNKKVVKIMAKKTVKNEDGSSYEIAVVNDVVLKHRVSACATCPFFHKEAYLCGRCGCYMPGKIEFQDTSCPIGKWESHHTEEDAPFLEHDPASVESIKEWLATAPKDQIPDTVPVFRFLLG